MFSVGAGARAADVTLAIVWGPVVRSSSTDMDAAVDPIDTSGIHTSERRPTSRGGVLVS